MELQFVKGQRGNDNLICEGFRFVLDKKKLDDTVYWKCAEYSKYKCLGRCKTSGNHLLNHSNNHNHPPSATKIEVKRTLNLIKERCITSTETTQKVIADCTTAVNLSVASALPSVSSLKRTIQNTRTKNLAPLPLPTHLADLQIPPNYQKTLKIENFLAYDSGPEEERILIFTTNENLNLLSRSEHWFLDGTFKTCPILFAQIYTIHGIVGKVVVPLIYALLPRKNQATYTRMLEALNTIKPGLNPVTALADFELALFNSLSTVYPNLIQRGCFFHLCQNVWKHIQQNPEILSAYTNSSDFELNLRKLVALSFVPVADVEGAFNSLIEDDNFFVTHATLLQPVVDYFEDTYIGRLNRRGVRTTRLFSIPLWNNYDATLNDWAKTNNSVEGFHRAFSSMMGMHHPNVWKCINIFQLNQSLNEVKIGQILSGHAQPLGKKVYKDMALRIKAIVEDYPNRTILEYLQSLSCNLQYYV